MWKVVVLSFGKMKKEVSFINSQNRLFLFVILSL